jgi:hypothetical protein
MDITSASAGLERTVTGLKLLLEASKSATVSAICSEGRKPAKKRNSS